MSHNNVITPEPHDRRKNVCPKCQMHYVKSLKKRVGRYFWRKDVVVAYSCPLCGIIGAPMTPHTPVTPPHRSHEPEYLITETMLKQWRGLCVKTGTPHTDDDQCRACEYRGKGNRSTCCDFDDDAMEKIFCSRPAPSPDTLGELKITQDMLYEFCEWFCDHTVDCSEAPCNVSVSQLHERLEGIMKQMKEHPEYLKKWNVKRAEQESLRSTGGERT